MCAALICPGIASADETVTYVYDARGRVVQVLRSGTVNNGVQATYSYDRADNRTQVTVTGVPAAPTFSIADATVTEGGTLVFTVTLTGSATTALSVSAVTANGTAAAPGDYAASAATLSFAPGETTKTFSVSTVDDMAAEGTEAITVTLSNPTGGAVIGSGQATGTITDNDAPPVSFAVSDAYVTEGGALAFEITKTGSTTATITLSRGSSDGTATELQDYQPVSGTLSFGPAETVKTVYVSTVTDSLLEGTETMTLSLSGASGGAMIVDSQGTGYIEDAPQQCFDGGQPVICPPLAQRTPATAPASTTTTTPPPPEDK